MPRGLLADPYEQELVRKLGRRSHVPYRLPESQTPVMDQEVKAGLERLRMAGRRSGLKPNDRLFNASLLQDVLAGAGQVASAPVTGLLQPVLGPALQGMAAVADRVPLPSNLLTYKKPGDKIDTVGSAARQTFSKAVGLVDSASDAIGYPREYGREAALAGAGLLAPSVARGVGRVADAAEGLINKAGRSFKRPGNVMMSGGGPVRSRSWSAPKLGDETVAVYHGTGGDHANLMPQSMNVLSSGSREGPIGVWTTNDPRVASSFADFSARGSGANVRPLAIKLKNPLELKSYDEIRDLVDKFTQFERPGYVVGGRQIRMMGDKVDYDGLRAFLRDQGYDGIALRQTLMDSLDGQPIDQFISLDSQSVSPRFGGLLSQPVKLADDGIIAYHGSPHSFDKFSMDKIGTGEGAQAYGHGLYFAEAEDVAKSYKNAGPAANQHYDRINKRMTELAKEMDAISMPGQYRKFMDPERGAALANEYDALMEARRNVGHTYQVRLNVKPDELLDWDKPLSEQPHILKALNSDAMEPTFGRLPWDKSKISGPDANTYSSGGQFIKANDHKDQVKFIENMRDAGVKGIRYLDQGSRNAAGWHITPPDQTVSGKWMVKSSDYNSKGMHFDTEDEAKAALSGKVAGQTYNYVIFDDKLITILKKYGIPFTAGTGGAVMVSGQDMPPELAAQMAPAA